MQSTTKNTEKGMIELTITVEPEEIKHLLERAAQEISKEKPIEGFRPGKAGYETVAKRYGSGPEILRPGGEGSRSADLRRAGDQRR
jgi:FKBP-type peptidyl-prolyl cis-trans isomerase (trigger factor)